MGIVEFLTARYNEDQARAEAATQGQWVVYRRMRTGDYPWMIGAHTDHDVIGDGHAGGVWEQADAEFIAANSPARVLADLEAKRGILRRYREMAEGLAQAEQSPTPANRMTSFSLDMLTVNVTAYYQVVRLLAAPYAGHADYDPAWTLDA